ncbi:MAG: thiamine pyrophosphate-dependent dehydrogenase E1 component subunit alpha [archaeon]
MGKEKTELDLLELMLKIRFFEEKIDFLFTRNRIHGTAHLCIGQEAIPAAICSCLGEKDIVTSTHRGHGHAIAKGLDIKCLMAELQGKAGGYCSGKGGTQHTMYLAGGFLANGVTGGMVPVAAGLALSNKIKETGHVVVAFFGDGAMNEGYVHEALNIASVWKLPIVFVCENNLYAMSTNIKNSTLAELTDIPRALKIPSKSVDGNDVLSLHSLAHEIIIKARTEGPYFLECRTYRYAGHSKNDQCLYRPKGELESWKKKDPIYRLKKHMIDAGMINQAKFKCVEEKIRGVIEDAAEFAACSDEPTVNQNERN